MACKLHSIVTNKEAEIVKLLLIKDELDSSCHWSRI